MPHWPRGGSRQWLYHRVVANDVKDTCRPSSPLALRSVPGGCEPRSAGSTVKWPGRLARRDSRCSGLCARRAGFHGEAGPPSPRSVQVALCRLPVQGTAQAADARGRTGDVPRRAVGDAFRPLVPEHPGNPVGGISSPGRPEQEPLRDRAGEERGAPEHLGHAGLGAGGRCRKVSWGPWGAVDPIPMSLHPVGFSEGTF